MNSSFTIQDFSEHLFWDTNRASLDFQLHKEQIVYQVVEFGLMNDWNLLQQIYPPEQLKEIVMNLKALDKVTLSFLAHFFQVEKEQFRCYKLSQSPHNFWNS